MIREIFSMPRADAGYPHNFGVDSEVFKRDESETEAKTNRGYRVCLLLVGSPLLAWRVHAQTPLFTHYVHKHSHKILNIVINSPVYNY